MYSVYRRTLQFHLNKINKHSGLFIVACRCDAHTLSFRICLNLQCRWCGALHSKHEMITIGHFTFNFNFIFVFIRFVHSSAPIIGSCEITPKILFIFIVLSLFNLASRIVHAPICSALLTFTASMMVRSYTGTPTTSILQQQQCISSTTK